jgi:hypothetical protein
VKGTFEVLYKKKWDEEYDQSKKDLLEKLVKVQGARQKYFGNRIKTMPWHVQALKGAIEAHMDGGVVWLPPKAKVIEIPRNKLKGGYTKVQRVRIVRMENTPSNIDFAGKKSKAQEEYKKMKERSLEALACPISYLGVIKFWALHPTTIEVYTPW